ncbi:MAG: ATP-binding cassette domain-containing protein [Candidatus Nanopelagicales bacterium]
MSTDAVIDIHGLVKSFGTTRALDGLDLVVRRGETHGFLGPNGAGKTTTLRILLGMLRADGGTATLLGGDPWHDGVALHARLAYVPGDVALWPSLTGGETIDILGRMRGGLDPARRAHLVEAFALDPSMKVSAYSKGNKQKVALVAALAADVELYVFDEPTDGLDPLMSEVFRTEVAALRADGRTVLLSSHVLAEVDAVCDRISIVRAGRIVESGSLADLRHLQRMSVVAMTSHELHGLEDVAGLHDVTYEDRTLRCSVEPHGLADLLTHLTAAGIVSLESRPPTLEEMFLRFYERGGDAR